MSNPWKEWLQDKQAEQRAANIESEAAIQDILNFKEKTPMTEQEGDAARALAKCTFLPGSYNKRFAHALRDISNQETPRITERQRHNLWRLVYMHRRQIKNKALVRIAEELQK